jgi:hypothetical protein
VNFADLSIVLETVPDTDLNPGKKGKFLWK